MAELSPVLEAYFGGQKQQTDLISTAKELSDSALRRQQAQEELKQRQQTIDEIAKQHGVENERSQSQLELQQLIAANTHKYQMNEAASSLVKELQNSNIAPDQMHDHLASLGIPGFAATPSPSDSGNNGLPGRTPLPVNIPNVNQPQINPLQKLMLPSGDEVTVPAWKTGSQIASENAQALIPSEVSKYNQTVGNMQTQRQEAMLSRLQEQLGNKDSEAALQRELQRQLADMRVSAAETASAHKLDMFMMTNGLPTDPDEAKKMIASYARDEMTGKGTGNPRTAYGPVVGNMVTKLIDSSGGRVLPSTVRDAAMGSAADVSQTLATLEQLRTSLPVSNTKTGAISNILADKFGSSGLSPYKSIYDAVSTDIIPKMDVALGFTPGALSRAPKLYDKIKSIAPLPGDGAAVIEQKTANAADIFLSSINKKLSGYSATQRAAIWQDIANDHPELVNTNKTIRQKLFEAGTTGNYTPGTLYKDWGGK